jgi:hypothetical protein
MPTPGQMMRADPRPTPRRSTLAQTAVEAFEDACRAEDLLQRKMVASENAAMYVPEEDRAWYVEQTEKIRLRYDLKREARPNLYESILSKLLRRKAK